MGAKLSFEMRHALQLIKEGSTIADASRIAGIGKSAIYEHYKRNGITLPAKALKRIGLPVEHSR